VVLPVVLVAILGSLASGQEPIHVAVNLVNVAFSARDARGALLDHLTKDDVEIFEDNTPQKIAFLRGASMFRRRRQFQRTRYDEHDRDGAGRKCSGVHDSVHRKRARKADGAK
jgi:hypothetical protein